MKMSQSRAMTAWPLGLGRIAPLLLIIPICLARPVRAETFTLDLTSTALWDRTSSTGLWNSVTGVIQGAVYANSNPIDFGDGSDGPFLDGPTQTGITVTGSTITFNTDDKDEFNFSSFRLTGGKTVTAVGSSPLKIRIFGTTTIDTSTGPISISLDGQAGQDNGSPGAGNATIGPILGGEPGAGGGKGGNGAAIPGGVTPTPEDGLPSGRGGSGGGTNFAGSQFQNGGGGGCNADGATPSVGGSLAGTCPLNQAALAATFDASPLLQAGAGGGGGTSCHTGCADFPVGGAGGGGGAGAIQLASLGPIDILPGNPFNFTARGGAGGRGNAGVTDDCGGGGGGGSGGSIWLQSAGAITGTGTFSVTGGAAGISTNPAANCALNFYGGGAGAPGSVRADTSPASAIPTLDLALTAAVPALPFVVFSQPLGFEHGYFDLLTAQSTKPGCGLGDLTVTYQGSETSDFANAIEVDESQISQLGSLPYVRFKVAIAAVAPASCQLSALSVNYELATLKDMLITGQPFFCGSTRGPGSDKNPFTHFHLFAGNLFILILAGFSARRIQLS